MDGNDAVARLLDGHDADVIATTLWLRERLRGEHPELRERVYRGWHGIGFHHPAAGYVCALFPRERSVQLAFEQGATLTDPSGLLSGGGSQVRYAVFEAGARPDPAPLLELLDEAIALGTR